MSDYKYVKVIRYKNHSLLRELLPNYVYGNHYQDLIDNIMKSHPEYSENPMYRKFRLGYDACDDYIDFVLEESYGERCGEWYQTARLTDEEFKVYQKLFSEFLGVHQDSIKTLCKVGYYRSYTGYEPPFIAYEEYDYSIEDEINKRIALEIINIFEEKLEELDITLPDDSRKGEENEARIFGDTYYKLETKILNVLERNYNK